MNDSNDAEGAASTLTSGDTSANGTSGRRRGGGGLSSMLLPELQQLAGSLGISGTARMRKSQLIAAIQERQTGGSAGSSGGNGSAPAEQPVSRRDDVRSADDRPD